MPNIEYGVILKAKDGHPIYYENEKGIAFVTEGANGTDFFTYMWVYGDARTSGFSGDTGAIKHLDSWFDVIPEEEYSRYLPEGFVPPPNPMTDPMAAFMAMFN